MTIADVLRPLRMQVDRLEATPVATGFEGEALDEIVAAIRAQIDWIEREGVSQINARPARKVERVLTVTVYEHTWTTYRVPVSPDFDPDEDFAVEDLIVNTDEDELEMVEGAVEHREITVDKDERIGS